MSRLPNLSALRAFDAAARHASFTRAADELGLTQAAISRHIRNLEDEIGVQLFRRSHKAVSLTEAGRRYAKRVAQGFGALRYQDPDAPSERPKIVLEVDSLLCRFWLIPLLSQGFPGSGELSLDLRVHVSGTQVLPIDTDIALTRGAHDREGFKRYRLLSPRIVAFACPTLGINTLAEIQESTLLHYQTKEDWRLLCKAAGSSYPQAAHNLSFSRPDQLIDAAFHRLGIGTGEDVLVAQSIKEKRLALLGGASLTGRAYYMATRKPRLTPHAGRFAAWLMSQAEDTSHWQTLHRTTDGAKTPRP